tara:strand:- start:1413 stop:1583 length:171 start_codon:yes stop_codon:yes gene_type:complete
MKHININLDKDQVLQLKRGGKVQWILSRVETKEVLGKAADYLDVIIEIKGPTKGEK